MGVEGTSGGRSRNLILTAMIFAVAMTFIDQTIVSIAAPQIQDELHLSGTGIQWGINAYLLALAAFFAYGGRLADTHGHKRMVVLGVVIFAGASALCGLTPKTGIAETWLVVAVRSRESAVRSCSRRRLRSSCRRSSCASGARRLRSSSAWPVV